MAFTETETFVFAIGDRMFICYYLQGDGSDTTWTAPCGTIDAAWIQPTTAENDTTGITFSTNVVTFSTAPAATSYFYTFVVGTA